MIGIARAPGTCGEFVQGNINGTNFLVTCPVDMYSVATVKLNKSGEVVAEPGLDKAREAVARTLQFLGRSEMGAEVEIDSQIPRGKGMASSTADIAATCAATAAALGLTLSPEQIANVALAIEPTDGIMFPGITMFDHLEGRVCRSLGPAPELQVIIVDLGGTVDTIEFNAHKDLAAGNRLKEHQVAAALGKLEHALLTGDARLTGEAATESALANQTILFKAEVPGLIDLCRELGGVGINVAHSGTVVGLLFEKKPDTIPEITRALASAGFAKTLAASVIGGGIQVYCDETGGESWQSLHTYTEATCGRLQSSMG